MSDKSILHRAFSEVYAKKPRTVPKRKKGKALRKNLIAIALSKARAAGASIPKR